MIRAENASLLDVLTRVGRKVNTLIELPPGAGQDKIFVRIGPRPIREALISLLNGSRFNYVMLGPDSGESPVRRLILMPRTGDEPVLASASPNDLHNQADEPVQLYNSTFRVEPGEDSSEPAQQAAEPAGDPEELKRGQELDQMQKQRLQLRQQQQTQAQPPPN